MLRAALCAFLFSAAPALAQGLAVEDAYAIAATPMATMGTAYMVIRNEGDAEDRLLSAASPAAESVVLHESIAGDDGVMRMESVGEGLPIPAGGGLALERGGIHLMFLGLTDRWEDGDVIPLTLTFERAGAVAVEVPVDLSRLSGDHAGHGAAMDHDH